MKKQCNKCGEWKELSSEFFWKDSKIKDGFCGTCKACMIAYRNLPEVKKKLKKQRQTESYLEKNRIRCKKYYDKPEKRKRILERNKKWYATHERNWEYVYSYSRKYDKENKEKKYAHGYVAYKRRKGLIIKPNICSNCGKRGKICAHHEDYMKPEKIIWLCAKCHCNLHRNELKKMV
ncbi:MAG: hypothetical protein PHW73_12430 [Atribacterota bacterium]|nr:hypothetical protein [Atribacterota bacterium]